MTEFQWPENCLDCDYYHNDVPGWATFCDLFHGNGIDPECPQKKSSKCAELRRVE